MKPFRLIVVQSSLLLTGAASAFSLLFDAVAAKGILLGGLAGVLGFWIVARETDRATREPLTNPRNDEVANPGTDTLKSARPRVTLPRKWFALRMLLYTGALVKGYTLDPVYLRGFLGVAGALMIVRLVVTVIGITGWDLKKQDVKSLES